MICKSPLALALLLGLALAGDVILPPADTSKTHIGLVLIQGASVPADRYAPLAKAIQDELAADYSLFVGLPSFLLDTPDPLTISGDVDGVLSELHKQGLQADAPLFVGGHSLGGIVVQNYAKGAASKFHGQVLMGSFLNRGNINGTTMYPLSTLTIGGEVDGLARMSRIMESAVALKQVPKDFPVVLLRGVSHMQFASGTPPTNVKNNDLKPEVSIDEAHTAVAVHVAAYFKQRLEGASQIYSLVAESNAEFLGPWEQAFQLEGYYHLKQPCYCVSLRCPEKPECRGGSDWVASTAQKLMAGLDGVELAVQDNFHRVYTVTPVHLPEIENQCSQGQTDCKLTSQTVTENLYSTVDDLFDTGFQSITASEMRCKMMSRQSFQKAAGVPNPDFDVTDAPSICAQINQAALDWALDNTGSRTMDRYKKLGEQMEMGEDEGPYNAGPLWIWTYMDYKEEDVTNGVKKEVVRSPMMKTPTDYPISSAAGFHYCKLLSPARALEWIYVDSLYARDSIKNEATMATE